MGELKRSPRPPSRNKGCLLLRGGEGKGGEGTGKGGEGKGRGKGRGNLLQGARGDRRPCKQMRFFFTNMELFGSLCCIKYYSEPLIQDHNRILALIIL